MRGSRRTDGVDRTNRHSCRCILAREVRDNPPCRSRSAVAVTSSTGVYDTVCLHQGIRTGRVVNVVTLQTELARQRVATMRRDIRTNGITQRRRCWPILDSRIYLRHGTNCRYQERTDHAYDESDATYTSSHLPSSLSGRGPISRELTAPSCPFSLHPPKPP